MGYLPPAPLLSVTRFLLHRTAYTVTVRCHFLFRFMFSDPYFPPTLSRSPGLYKRPHPFELSPKHDNNYYIPRILSRLLLHLTTHKGRRLVIASLGLWTVRLFLFSF